MMHHVGDARARLLLNPHDRAVRPSPLARGFQRLIVAGFLAIVLVAGVFFLLDRWRRGSFVLGGALVYLSLARWVVDSDVMGVLAVRSRKFDASFTATLGLLIILLAVSVDPLTG